MVTLEDDSARRRLSAIISPYCPFFNNSYHQNLYHLCPHMQQTLGKKVGSLQPHSWNWKLHLLPNPKPPYYYISPIFCHFISSFSANSSKNLIILQSQSQQSRITIFIFPDLRSLVFVQVGLISVTIVTLWKAQTVGCFSVPLFIDSLILLHLFGTYIISFLDSSSLDPWNILNSDSQGPILRYYGTLLLRQNPWNRSPKSILPEPPAVPLICGFLIPDSVVERSCFGRGL